MLDELVRSIVAETVKQTLQEIGAMDAPKQKTQDLMTVKQLAEYLNMSTSWIYQNIKSLPHEKHGRNVRFSKSEIDDWRGEQRAAKEEVKRNVIHVSGAGNKRGLYKVV